MRRKALRITESTVPDLIFMDIRLREANGLDPIIRMRARHPKIVSIVFTTSDTEYLEAAREYTDYYLSKRPTSEEVFALIESILVTKAQHRTRKSILVG